MDGSFDINDIQERLPHRFPFLLIDRVLSFAHGPDPLKYVGRKVVVRKNVTINEPYFVGHFPGNPVMPGVLLVESMAQAGAIACAPNKADKIEVLFAKIVEAKFKCPVIPGDVLEIHAEVKAEKSSIVTVFCQAFCDRVLVAQVQVMAKIIKK